MAHIPIFIEMADVAESNICAIAVQSLLDQKVEPLGLARNLQELHDLLKQLNENSLQAGIFIVNTFKAKTIIPKLDELMGEVPAVYLRRGMFAGQSGLMEHLVLADGDQNQSTMNVLKKMTPRLTSVWTYGGQNIDQVAERIVKCTLRFTIDSDFRHYEIANKV